MSDIRNFFDYAYSVIGKILTTPETTKFRDYVYSVVDREKTGKIVEVRWGKTPLNQEFIHLITLSKTQDGCEVRSIVDEEHRDLKLAFSNECYSDEILCFKKFRSLQEAKDYVFKAHREYTAGNFKKVQFRVRKLPTSNREKYLKRGDFLIRRYCFSLFFHVGILLKEPSGKYSGQIAHINNEDGSNFKPSAYARIDSLEKFMKGATGRIHVPCFRRRLPDHICREAERLVEERYLAGKFHLLRSNCQHFATLCVYGFPFLADTALFGFYPKLKKTENPSNFFHTEPTRKSREKLNNLKIILILIIIILFIILLKI